MELCSYETSAVAKGTELGRGAYGVVHEYEVAGFVCAGKKIHALLLTDMAPADTKRRYLQESALMAKLRHPNIVQFLGVTSVASPDCSVLLMEKLTCDLHSLLEDKQYNFIPLSLRVAFLADIARGLSYLHNYPPHSIVHRDLSARNVLLSSSLIAKISDLGNCLIVTPEKASTLSCTRGAPVYMPQDSTPQPSLDIFSFGHLSLFAAIQEFPINLKNYTYPTTYPKFAFARTEVQRRDTYFDKLRPQREHSDLVRMIEDCLSDESSCRPTAEQLLHKLYKMELEYRHVQDNKAKLKLIADLKKMENVEMAKEIEDMKLRCESSRREFEKIHEELISKIKTLEMELSDCDAAKKCAIEELKERLDEQHKMKRSTLKLEKSPELEAAKDQIKALETKVEEFRGHLFGQKEMRGGAMQCGQKTSQAVIQDFRVLFSSLQAKAVRDLSTQNISKTDSKLALCCVFEEAYRASHNSVMESLRTKLDMMLFQVSEDPLTVEYRQLAGAYGEVTHLTRTTDCVNQADIKQKVWTDLPDYMKHTHLQHLQSFVDHAVEVAKEMVTLQPPMVISTKKCPYNPTIHEESTPNWKDDHIDEHVYYFSPTLFCSCDEKDVAVKGQVGNDWSKCMWLL